MAKVLIILFCLFFSFNAFASFSTAVGSRPHTLCWEKQNRLAGIHVYLTDLHAEPEQTQVEIRELSQQDERRLLAQETQVQIRDSFEVYEGSNFRLEISRDFLMGSSQRLAHLIYHSENGEEISRALLCDSLMYPMDKGPASF